MNNRSFLPNLASGKAFLGLVAALVLCTAIYLATAFNQTEATETTPGAPYVVTLSPVDGAFIDTSSGGTSISVSVKDDADQLDANSVQLTIDGIAVKAPFKYTGHYEYDSCGTPYYIIEDNKSGTVTYGALLKDGRHTAQLSIADIKGNFLTKQWSFTTGSKPKFSSYTPANATVLNSVYYVSVSVKVVDEAGIATESIEFKVNDNIVAANFNPSTGIISYTGEVVEGINVVNVSVADSLGNVGTTSWSFMVNKSSGPQIISVGPTEGSTTSSRILSATIKSSNYKIGVINLSIDGTPVKPNFTYAGHWENDSCTGDYYVIDSFLDGTIENTLPNLKDGNHTVVLTVADEMGNKVIKTWSFTLGTQPKISDAKPAISYISELRPTISAKVTDLEGDGNVVMTIDGVEVKANYNSATGLLSYTPAVDLTNESMHKAKITVSDLGGSSSYEWQFYINTYKDMNDANYSSCNACHPVSEPRAIESQVHRGLAFSGSHTQAGDDCYDCHSYITVGAGCAQCHEDPDTPGDEGLLGHGDTLRIQYGPRNYDPTAPMRVTQNREIYDCIICHQPGSQAKAYEGYWAKPTRVMNNHDIPELHKTQSSSCNKCHALSLTREHAQAGRVDDAGNAINCNTCHKSTDTKVTTAITNNDKNCSACHESADHESLHIINLGGCQTSGCHSQSISADHASKGYSCDTCHSSTASPKVQQSISAGDISCTACHSSGHSITFADKVPADIPLYGTAEGQTQMNWSSPIEAGLFVADPGFPTGYETGKLILSSRSADLTAANVWTFYNEQLVANGWTMVTDAPSAEATKFSVEFQKAGRYVTLRSYATTTFASNESTSGLRTEIWYK